MDKQASRIRVGGVDERIKRELDEQEAVKNSIQIGLEAKPICPKNQSCVHGGSQSGSYFHGKPSGSKTRKF